MESKRANFVYARLTNLYPGCVIPYAVMALQGVFFFFYRFFQS